VIERQLFGTATGQQNRNHELFRLENRSKTKTFRNRNAGNAHNTAIGPDKGRAVYSKTL
jgi:hypothetical protein